MPWPPTSPPSTGRTGALSPSGVLGSSGPAPGGSTRTASALHLSRLVCRASGAAVRQRGRLSGQAGSSFHGFSRRATRPRGPPPAATGRGNGTSDPWALQHAGRRSGLRTGTPAPHDRSQDNDPARRPPPRGGGARPGVTFLATVTNDDPELQAYLAAHRRLLPHRAHRARAVLPLRHRGQRQVGVLQRAAAILGDYAATRRSTCSWRPPASAIRPTSPGCAARASSASRPSRAAAGRRANSSDDRRRPIKARFMRQDFFDFVPQFKLVIAGNHKPRSATRRGDARRLTWCRSP